MSVDTQSDILPKLLERRADLLKEIAALDVLIGHYQRLSNQKKAESADALGQLSLYGTPSSRAVKAAEIARTVDAARRLILATGRPMKRRDIAVQLEDQGFNLPGSDRVKVLGTNLWRSGKFRMIGKQGYWPKDTPYRDDGR